MNEYEEFIHSLFVIIFLFLTQNYQLENKSSETLKIFRGQKSN